MTLLTTEVEARSKRCPYKRGNFCDASGCMAWQWKIGPPTPLERAIYQETSVEKDWRGYCGAFGRPE